MNKMQWLKLNVALLFASALVQTITGLLMFFSVDSELIAETHEYNGLLFVVLVVMHIALNWGWIKSAFLKRITRP